jgi:HNH endonuclease
MTTNQSTKLRPGRPLPNFIAQRFGMLVVLKYDYEHHKWHCLCDCGTESLVLGGGLRDGSTKSCGCLRRSLRGEKSPHWRGGTKTHSAGYILAYAPGHPRAKGCYVYEHILVAEKMLGRMLLHGEMVHHLDHDKTNNKPENLYIAPSPAHHLAYHREPWSQRQLPDEENCLIACGCGCGKTFQRYDGVGRPRKYIHGHNHKKRNSIYCQGDEPNRLVECACGCKEPMWLYAEKGRIRRYIHGHNGRGIGRKKKPSSLIA